MRGTDFELQHARMTVLHSERDDLRLEKAALLSRCDVLLQHRKTLLAEMREFAAVAREQSQDTAPVLLECEAGASP
jgi:hypothetical protein